MSPSNQGLGNGSVVTVNVTGLLSFMLGPTETTMSPELAPDGIVTVMDVPLQEFTVTGLPFSMTTLVPCGLPKLEPVITTWLPIAPVVADRCVITGAGAAVVLTDT